MKNNKTFYFIRFVKSILIISFLLFISGCGYVIYELFKPALPNVYYYVPLKANKDIYEFEYTPPWAILRKQTLILAIEKKSYNENWEKTNIVPYNFILNFQNNYSGILREEFFPKVRMEIFYKNEKLYERIFSYDECESQTFIKPVGNLESYDVFLFKEKHEERMQRNFWGRRDDSRYFEFDYNKKYKIVFTDLSTNKFLNKLNIFFGSWRSK